MCFIANLSAVTSDVKVVHDKELLVRRDVSCFIEKCLWRLLDRMDIAVELIQMKIVALAVERCSSK